MAPETKPPQDPTELEWFLFATIMGGIIAGIVFWVLVRHEKQATHILDILIRKVESWV